MSSVLSVADRRALVSAAVLVCALSAAAAAQKPSNTDEVKHFPSSVVWSVEISAPVTSPVAAGDRLFVALASGVSARNVADSKIVWNVEIVADGPMAAAGDRLIVQTKEDLRALNAANGEVVWTDTPGRLTSPPFIYEEWLFVATGETLIAYRVADGTRVWTSEVGAIEEPPAVGGKRVFVPAADGRVVALDLDSGKPVWEHDVGIKPSQPLVYGDNVLVGSAAKFFCSLRALNGKEDWCYPVSAAVKGAAVADASRVYFVTLDNLLRAHDRRRGARLWQADLRYRPAAGPSLVGHTVSAPGPESKLQAFNVATGKPAGELVLADKMLFVPVFIAPADKGPMRLAVLSGDLPNVWKLTLAEAPPYFPPPPTVGPLSVLPGQVIPVGVPPVPRE